MTVVMVVRCAPMAAAFTVNMFVMAFMSMPFVVMVAAFAVGVRMRALRLSDMRLVAVAAASAVCVSMFMLGFASTCFVVMAAAVAVSVLGFASACFGAMAAVFAVLVSVFTSTRFVAVTAAFTMPVGVRVIIGMRVNMPFVPVG
ncbi:hypothetical protein GNZ12_10845 [Paraburkholderia sp. 1N]|uniref:Uncharacterized protein n=1 Tax=Paraburkholderia solitsugae TaxID=2675748 RepID=A0ABX2BPT3_9BURK|nr:hypothetical protein [Paraburkholderia solitsugae]NPT41805.1 hypothetical protein [Paraburkholderia solitsugae]